MKIANTPDPPYYAVIFTNLLNNDSEGYSEMGELIESLVINQDGYLGHESVRDGMGITVSYWDSLESIKKWKMNSEHLLAQKMGREKWYTHFKTRICKVESDYEFDSNFGVI
ncbi:antibiotic biosynthesis monooxygenase family protein [Belliella aquatica]|uniref:Antibiotic biosynthesis monooxygenase n=1 Tax=Belliella aquatica TaxID=1323734 RepID=A0ABQ1MHY9_9BACT|nr:antibiotic biosynthesis monooxygenase [Belliella aquatica]MCH7405202.1 antibiotic biosynthesis monooxygenase [Belliella aquatica]GGC38940.1 antibiotic biosynthesis monooxygenase [Belliella aquatica]